MLPNANSCRGQEELQSILGGLVLFTEKTRSYCFEDSLVAPATDGDGDVGSSSVYMVGHVASRTQCLRQCADKGLNYAYMTKDGRCSALPHVVLPPPAPTPPPPHGDYSARVDHKVDYIPHSGRKSWLITTYQYTSIE